MGFAISWWFAFCPNYFVPASWWTLGTNTIQLTYEAKDPTAAADVSIVWIDVLLRYTAPE